MPNHIFSPARHVPASVDELMTDLQVKLDQRKLPLQLERHTIQYNQINQGDKDIALIKQYQQLAGAVKKYFFKQGKEVTYESYREFMQKMGKLIQETTIKDDEKCQEYHKITTKK